MPKQAPVRGSWRQIVETLDLTCIALIILLGIACGILQPVQPVQRPIFLNDATTAYSHTEHDMPFWVALLVPFLVLVATAVAVECWLIKQGCHRATANIINIILACFASIAVVGFLTELFKRICGRLRPDFLDRCQPQVTADGLAVPFGTFPNVVCTDTNGSIIKDGHMSFPSGHSSCSMAFSLYSALYLLWCLHWRDNGALGLSLLSPAKTVSGRICKELISLGVVLLVLFDLAWPWGVAVSRFRDNRHNVSDVVAGLLLAACFVPVFVVRLVRHCTYWWSRQEQESAGANDVHVLSHPVEDGIADEAANV